MTFTDADAFHTLMVEPDVRRFLLDDMIMPREWADQVIAESSASFAAHGWGLWGIRENAAPALIGIVGFREFFEPPESQLLYALHPDRWGRGLATEASEAMIRYGIDRLGMTNILACADPPNLASLAVMRRLGLRFLKRVVRDGKESICYGVESADWCREMDRPE